MKKFIAIILISSFVFTLMADEFSKEIMNIKYKKKSPHKAAILSGLFPGAGQFYADKSSITTYIFPIIEIGLIYGYFYYTDQGEDKERAYEKWATEEIIGYEDDDEINGEPIYRYSRDYQDDISQDLIEQTTVNNYSFYTNHFSLDDDNTQHFYEDIGKYDKYIFGWTDWFDIYGGFDGQDVNPSWRPFYDSSQGLKWSGNNVTNPDSQYYIENQELYDEKRGIYSGMRAEYIIMRQKAEDDYNAADHCNMGLVFNHILSALDAIRVTKKYNNENIYGNNFNINFSPVWVNNQICPAVTITQRF